jgi:hypothetical protein
MATQPRHSAYDELDSWDAGATSDLADDCYDSTCDD